MTAWEVHAGAMVAIMRNSADIGPRAIAAYQSAIAVIEKPTTSEGAKFAFQQLRDAVNAYKSGKAQTYEATPIEPPPDSNPRHEDPASE